MGKFFSVNKNQAAVLSTILVLMLLGVSYFFIYVPKNEKTVQQRRFRCLQNIDTNVHSKIENSISLLYNLLPDASMPANGFKKFSDTLNKYIADYPKDNFTLLPVEQSVPEEKAGNPNAQYFILSAKRNIKSLNKIINVRLLYGYGQFIKSLLPAEVFDNYIVFVNDKSNSKDNAIKEVYETFPSGLSIKARDSIFQTKGGVTAPGMRTLNLGGDDYKVFSQPVDIPGNKELIIVGLVSDSNYQKEKNQLPLGVVLLLLTVAIVLVVSLPWIKLYHMGNKDKLTVVDGVSTVLVSMLLMSLLFLVFFKYSIYFSPGYQRFQSSKDTLANKITKAFEKELDIAYSRLGECDNIYKQKKQRGSTDYTSVLTGIENGMDIHQVFWLNKNGIVKESWATDIKIAVNTDCGDRDYFKNTLNNNLNSTAGPDFYVDQVVSHTSGVFTSVIAKKSNDSTVVALGFTAKSLNNVVLPDGYQFAVIDSKGQVLYHSRAERNLNENLKREFADSTNLVSCLQAKSDTSFKGEYYGRQYNIKIMPFNNLPYFTVVFEDMEYNDARDTEPYAFTVSMLFCLLAFMVVQMCVVFFVSSRRSFFKKQLFETSWIGPKTTSVNQYNKAIIGNLVVIVLLGIFFMRSPFLTYMYMLLFSVTFINILLNGIFALHYKAQNKYYYGFKIIAIKWLLLFVGIIDYTSWLTHDRKSFWPASFWQLMLFEVSAVGFCAIFYFIHPYLEIAHTKFLLVTSWSRKYSYFKKWTYTKSFALMATTRLIITSGIPVAFIFVYSFNYEQSLDTRYRQLHFASALKQKIINDSINQPKANTANKPLTNPKKFRADYVTKIDADNISTHELDSISKGTLFNAGIYYDGIFIHDFEFYNITEVPPSKIIPYGIAYTKEDSISLDILSDLRLYRNNVALKSNNMDFPPLNSNPFFYKYTQKYIGDTDRAYTYFKVNKNKYLKLNSGRINYPHMIWQFWLLLILLIVVFYNLIHNIIKKLFALNLPLTDRWETVDEKLLGDNKLNALLFVLGSPGSGKLNKLKEILGDNRLDDEQTKELLGLEQKGDMDAWDEKLKEYKARKWLGNNDELLVYNEKDKSENNVFVADMIHISAEEGENNADWKACKEEALKKRYALVIINHFEYNIKDTKTNSIKLEFLESMMLKSSSKISIISTVHPLTFLDSFNDQQKKGSGDKQQTAGVPESELERWHVLLGHFRIIIEPLIDISKVKNTKGIKKIDENAPPFEHAIYDETKYSHFLNNMQQIAMQSTPLPDMQDVADVSDSLVFKLQITSHYFYTYIWQSLTKEEKFLLYDLAEDGLVNPGDDYNLSMLICKGLIIRPAGTLMLFNKGFRNFILTAIGNTEVNRIKDQVKDNGNWGSLKTPLIIAILAIFVFLITSQQEAYTRIITYVTALGAGVPAILKVFSLFGNGSTQKTS